MRRRPIVGVMGSGSEMYEDLSEPLGRWLAEAGFHLLTGGGGGIMAAVSRAFVAVENRRGMCLGILPAARAGSMPVCAAGYPNPWVEIPIMTHLSARGDEGKSAQSRNHINILTSDVVIALPGGCGTASEIELAVHYKKPVIIFAAAHQALFEFPVNIRRAKSLDEVQALVNRSVAHFKDQRSDGI